MSQSLTQRDDKAQHNLASGPIRQRRTTGTSPASNPTTDYLKVNATITTLLHVREDTEANTQKLAKGLKISRNGGTLVFVVKLTKWNKSNPRHLLECLLLALPVRYTASYRLPSIVTILIDGGWLANLQVVLTKTTTTPSACFGSLCWRNSWVCVFSLGGGGQTEVSLFC